MFADCPYTDYFAVFICAIYLHHKGFLGFIFAIWAQNLKNKFHEKLRMSQYFIPLTLLRLGFLWLLDSGLGGCPPPHNNF